VLTPDFDPVPESEMWAMARRGVSIHVSRVPWNRDARSFAEPPHVDTAAEQLAGHAGRLAYVSEFIEEAKASGLVQRPGICS